MWPSGKKITYSLSNAENCEHINFRTVYCGMSKTAKISICKQSKNLQSCCLQLLKFSHT